MNSRRNSGTLRWIVLCLVVVVALIAVAVGGRLVAYRTGWLVANSSSTAPETLFNTDDDQGSGAIDAATGEDEWSAVSADKIASALEATDADAGFAISVRDLSNGEQVYESNGDESVIPASNMKVMTTLAAIDKIGADTTFTTKVVLDQDGTVTLVGGGDVLLASTDTSYAYGSPKPATTAELAASTAQALLAQGITSITLNYDDSLFTGPSRHPDWEDGDMEFVNDISALMVDEGGGSSTPSQNAAQTFAAQLSSQGITVMGDPQSGTADQDATQLASVESLPLSQLVQECLRHSDNTIAEVLFRQLAIAYDQPGSFDGGVTALTQAMHDLGLWNDEISLHDGSGLSTNDRLTASSLSQAVVIATGRDDLRNLLAGLPVAAATGSLDTRYLDSTSSTGAGWVRAKTGTLDTASALTGYTPTADGSAVAFTIIANGDNSISYRPNLDELAAALTGCACSA